MRVSMFTGPYPVGEHMGGIGLRMWEIAGALADHGIDVTLACPPGSDTGWSGPGRRVTVTGEDNWAHLVDAADAVLTTDLPDARVLLRAWHRRIPQVADNAVPVEHLDYAAVTAADNPTEAYDDLRDAFLLQAWTADHFLVRSAVERAGLIGALAGIGRLGPAHHGTARTLAHLVTSVPIGFTGTASTPAQAAAATVAATEYAWSGGVWDFSDTAVLAGAVARLRDQGRPVRVRMLYLPPPDQVIGEGQRLRHLIDRLNLREHIVLPARPLPHTERDGVLAAAGALVCFGRPGVENDTCHRLRLRDALLYRLPVLIDAHGASGDWVTQTGIGVAVDTGNLDRVADAMAALAFEPEVARRCRAAIDTVRSRHRIDTTVGPLVRFLRSGRRAPDADGARQRAAVAQLIRRRPALTGPPRHPF